MRGWVFMAVWVFALSGARCSDADGTDGRSAVALETAADLSNNLFRLALESVRSEAGVQSRTSDHLAVRGSDDARPWWIQAHDGGFDPLDRQ